jgi:hypothetical protein
LTPLPRPEREQSGSDLIELSNDAVLEIYHELHDGADSGMVQLRYLRPVSNIAFRVGGSVDEMLTVRLV